MSHWELLLTASKSERVQFLHCAYSVLNNDNLYLGRFHSFICHEGL